MQNKILSVANATIPSPIDQLELYLYRRSCCMRASCSSFYASIACDVRLSTVVDAGKAWLSDMGERTDSTKGMTEDYAFRIQIQCIFHVVRTEVTRVKSASIMTQRKKYQTEDHHLTSGRGRTLSTVYGLGPFVSTKKPFSPPKGGLS